MKLLRGVLALATVAGVALAVPATASTARSWAQLKVRVVEACRLQSGLKSARVTEYWPDFEAHAAARVTGVYPQKHMQGRRAVMLCLYDKRTGKTEIQEPAAP